jgi:hypothetical protein
MGACCSTRLQNMRLSRHVCCVSSNTACASIVHNLGRALGMCGQRHAGGQQHSRVQPSLQYFGDACTPTTNERDSSSSSRTLGTALCRRVSASTALSACRLSQGLEAFRACLIHFRSGLLADSGHPPCAVGGGTTRAHDGKPELPQLLGRSPRAACFRNRSQALWLTWC